MEGFDHLLNWKLKAGSHPFPGKDGGTCINEAALIAAGFAYKPIRWVEEMPGAFSRPICRFAMLLNDSASEKDRQRLLPFVTGWLALTPRRLRGNGQPISVRTCVEVTSIFRSKKVFRFLKGRSRLGGRQTCSHQTR
jgi:hypothetical protein